MIRFMVPFLFLISSLLIIAVIRPHTPVEPITIYLVMFFTSVMLLYQARKRKKYIIEGNCNEIYDRIKNALWLWKEVKISKLDKTHHFIEMKSHFSFRSFGYIINVQLEPLRENLCAITISSVLNIGVWDYYNINQKNLLKIEEIIGLELISPTHFIFSKS